MIDAPTPAEGLELIPPPAHVVIVPRPDVVRDLPPIIGSGRPPKLPRRRLGRHAAATLALVALVAAGATIGRFGAGAKALTPLRFAPVVIAPPLRLEGALVRGASRDWVLSRDPLRLGVPVPVSLTAYCLRGTTRRDHYVREGIVASDPKHFPLGHYLEIYVGRQYWGRFLVDDTGGAIKDNKLDIWTPTCREARLFGRVKGTAVLVPRPRGAAEDTLTTGRLGGAKVALK